MRLLHRSDIIKQVLPGRACRFITCCCRSSVLVERQMLLYGEGVVLMIKSMGGSICLFIMYSLSVNTDDSFVPIM